MRDERCAALRAAGANDADGNLAAGPGGSTACTHASQYSTAPRPSAPLGVTPGISCHCAPSCPAPPRREGDASTLLLLLPEAVPTLPLPYLLLLPEAVPTLPLPARDVDDNDDVNVDVDVVAA